MMSLILNLVLLLLVLAQTTLVGYIAVLVTLAYWKINTK